MQRLGHDVHLVFRSGCIAPQLLNCVLSFLIGAFVLRQIISQPVEHLFSNSESLLLSNRGLTHRSYTHLEQFVLQSLVLILDQLKLPFQVLVDFKLFSDLSQLEFQGYLLSLQRINGSLQRFILKVESVALRPLFLALVIQLESLVGGLLSCILCLEKLLLQLKYY